MLLLAFAQGAAAPQPQVQQSPLISLMPIALIFIIFYFLLIRPQKKSQKEHQEMLGTLKKNDEVVTSGGIYGTIVNIQNDIITLRIDDNTRIKIQRSAISKLKKAKQE
jgi:preprotein translocase subunit YajC